jgi:abortive infection alpha-like protein
VGSGQDEAAAELVVRAARVAGRAARSGWRVARALPGGARAERELLRLESVLVAGMRGRWTEPVTLVLPPLGEAPPLRAGMAALLNRSANTDAAGAAAQLYAVLLRQLVPDEARILAALADGEPRPAVDVVPRNPFRNGQRVVLRNASTVGRAAGVAAPEYVPQYVTRLYRLGLVDIGDEAEQLAEQYEILLTDQQVRDALARGTRIVRRSVVISTLGRRFWLASDPTVP